MNTCDSRLLALVLGMHRSGTSAMARALPVLGISLGDHLIPAHPCNPKGFFEDADINAGNATLLKALGTGWEYPVSFRDRQADLRRFAAGEYGQAALTLLRDKFRAADALAEGQGLPLPAPLAFKEPRMSRLMAFWRPLMLAADCAPHVCLALRHPAHVAASLTARNGFPAAQGWRLWLHHTLDALEGSLGLPVLVWDYDTLLAAPERQIRRLAQWLGRPVDEATLRVFCDNFLDRGLRHHAARPASAPPPPATTQSGLRPEDMLPGEREILLAEDMYRFLRAAALDSDDIMAPNLPRRLARWRTALEALPPCPAATARGLLGAGA